MKSAATKIANITMLVLLLVSVVLTLGTWFGPVLSDEVTPTFLDTTYSWTGIMIFGALALTIVFELIGTILQPANAKRAIFSTLAIVAIIGIAWAFSDGTPMQIVGYEGPDNVPTMLKITDTGIYTMYVFLIASFATILSVEVLKYFK